MKLLKNILLLLIMKEYLIILMNNNKYLKFFIYLENKELTIAILLKKYIEEANILEERIDPFETSISNQDINVLNFI